MGTNAIPILPSPGDPVLAGLKCPLSPLPASCPVTSTQWTARPQEPGQCNRYQFRLFVSDTFRFRLSVCSLAL